MKKWAGVLRYFIYFILALFCFLLQTLPNGIQLFGVKIELLIPLIAAVALFEGPRGASIFAFFIGIMYDYACGQVFGINTIYFMIAAYVIAALPSVLIRVNVVSHSIISAILVFIQNFFVWLMFVVKGVSSSAKDIFFIGIVKSLVCVLGYIVIYLIVKFIYKKIETANKKEVYHY